jgi:hypothetical protein
VDSGDNPLGGKAFGLELLQGTEKGLELFLVLACGPPTLVITGGGHHSLRKGRQHPVVIPEIKPPVLPPLVRRHKGGRDVLLCPPRPQLEGAAASPHHHTNLLHVRRHDGELRGEEMGPQVSVGVNPPKPLANRRENGRLHDGVGVEVVKLHPVVVRERPHEAARRHPKPLLMKRGEADHVPRRRSRVGLAPEGQPFRLRPIGERMEQTLGNEGLQILRSDGGEGPRVTRRNDSCLVSHCRAEAVEAEGTKCVVFSSLCLLSQVAKAKAEGKDGSTNGRVNNRCRSLSQVYKDPGKIHPKLRPSPS